MKGNISQVNANIIKVADLSLIKTVETLKYKNNKIKIIKAKGFTK